MEGLPPALPDSRTSYHEPHFIGIKHGITIYPDETGPRLPLLGLRALTTNHLHLTVDGDRQLVWLRTLGWPVKFIRLLS